MSKSKPKINTCSGTSFSAAVLSGLLARSPNASDLKFGLAANNPAGSVQQVGFIADNKGAQCP